MPQGNSFASPKQIEYWANCNHRWNVKTGATRSGKTYMDYFIIPRRLLAVKGKDGLNVMLGNTRETLRRNVIVPMQTIYGTHRVGNIRADNSCIMFGEPIFILGADNIAHVDKIRGSSIKYCYGDEVTTWNEEVFDMLKSRLDKDYSTFDGTCNPAQPTHWFKAFLDSDADIYQQKYTIDDNPFIPKSFVENLKKEYAGTVYYKRYILGEWALAEGLIYPMVNEENYYTDADRPIALYSTSRRYIAVDYGTTNPCVYLDIYDDGKTLWVDREYRWDSRSTTAKMSAAAQKTDTQYGEDMDEFIKGGSGEECEIICDPSAASFIAELRNRGHYVKDANNEVLDGIRSVSVMLQRRTIRIHESCTGLITELQSYVWDDKASLIGEDKPVKSQDHGCDALRYGVMTKLPSWRIRT